MSVILAHPFSSPTTTVTLRNPNLGDSDTMNLRTRFGTAMDGSLYGYRHRPINIRLLLTFEALKDADITSLITFIQTSAGQKIKLTNHDGKVYRGFLLNEPFELESELNIICDDRMIVLEFEGESVEFLTFLLEDDDDFLTEDAQILLLEGF